MKTAIILLLCLNAHWASAASKTVAFVLFDAGETLSIRPVMANLRETGVSFKVLALATSAALLKDCAECVDLKRDCSVQTEVTGKTPHRLEPFTDQDLENIQNCLNPTLTVFGAPSMSQFQIATKFNQAGLPTVAYFDGLSPVLRGSIGHKFLNLVDEFWVPSSLIAHAAERLTHTSRIKAVGQPTLEIWEAAFRTESKEAIVNSIPGFDQRKKTLLFAGGYGRGYQESVEAFYEAASDLKETQIMISTHPRMGDALERELLKKFPLLKVLFIPPSIGTMKALIVSDLLVSQNSTTGIQALFVGKPSVYIDPVDTGYSNFIIDNGWARLFKSSSDLKQFFFATTSVRPTADPYETAGIPKDSVKVMSEIILNSVMSVE